MTDSSRFVDTSIRLLGVIYVLWGGAGVLLGSALLLLALGAATIAGAPAREASVLATRVTAASLSALGALLITGGAAHAWVGALLPRRRSAARLVALLLALANLPLLPFGTAFGAYGLWVLLDDRVRSRFDGAWH